MKGYVLRYLARVAQGASLPAARATIPLPFRALAVRGARAHAVAAGFETAHADDTAHVYRLAYLRARGVPATSDDPAWVTRAFEEHRDAGAERRAFVGPTLAILGVMLLVGAGGGAWWWKTANAAASTQGSSERAEPPSIDELFPVEAPDEDEHPLHDVFAEGFPQYTIALDARTRNEERPAPQDVASRRAQIIEALQREAPALLPSTNALLDAAESYAAAESPNGDELWLNQLVGFHDALEQEGVPFHLDAQLTIDLRSRRQRVLISTYSVLQRRVFLAGDQRIRQLDIQRLDHLNHDQSLLGYTRPEVRYALVRMDRIEGFLVEDVFPSAHASASSVIVTDYAQETGTQWVTDFEEWAHEDLRSESQAIFAAAVDPRSTALTDMAAAIVRRRDALRQLEFELRDRRVRLRPPRTYRYDVAQLAGLGDASGQWIGEVRAAERDLRTPPLQAAYDAVHAAFGLSVAEHEVQHRLDYEADRLVAVPEELSQYTGETESEDRVNRRAERSNAELSAYLSQIARRPTMARTSLIHVASFIMNRRAWRMPEAYAAVALFEALAADAGIEHAPLIARRLIARAEVARIYGALRERYDGEGLSALAGRTWSRLYGSQLTPITLQR